MPAATNVPPSEFAVSEERQVKALLRLLDDMGYQVCISPNGDWTVSRLNDLGERTVIGHDTAREVAAAARALAEALELDLVPAPLRAAS